MDWLACRIYLIEVLKNGAWKSEVEVEIFDIMNFIVASFDNKKEKRRVSFLTIGMLQL